MKVLKRETGEVFDCEVQSVDLNFDGRYVLRYVIGIENYQGFHGLWCVYENDKFNEGYKVVSPVNECRNVGYDKKRRHYRGVDMNSGRLYEEEAENLEAFVNDAKEHGLKTVDVWEWKVYKGVWEHVE